MATVADFIFLGSKITADDDCSHEIKMCLLLGRKAMTNRPHIKKQRHYFAYKALSNQSHGFSSSHVWMWELDNKKGWVPKNSCLRTVVLEKTLESPWTARREIKPVNPKGNQLWILIGGTDAEAEAPIVWPLDGKNWLIKKIPCCWERSRAGGEGDDGGWDDWKTWPTRWTWVWVSFGRW